jgi:hypothetical protein
VSITDVKIALDYNANMPIIAAMQVSCLWRGGPDN